MKMDMGALAKQMVTPAGKEPEAEGMPMDGMEVAAEEMMAGMQSGDPKAVAAALKNAVRMCMMMESGEGMEE